MTARHGVQLPLHYIHFKIENFSRSDDGVFSLYKGFVDPIVSRVVESCKVAKVVFFSFSCKSRGFLEQAIGYLFW